MLLKPGEKRYTQRCRLFIGNLPNDITEEAFKKLFAKYGEPSEVFINKGKGFGFIRLVRSLLLGFLESKCVYTPVETGLSIFIVFLFCRSPGRWRKLQRRSWMTPQWKADPFECDLPHTLPPSLWRTCLHLFQMSSLKRPFLSLEWLKEQLSL